LKSISYIGDFDYKNGIFRETTDEQKSNIWCAQIWALIITLKIKISYEVVNNFSHSPGKILLRY
jgi:hypothetical protein